MSGKTYAVTLYVSVHDDEELFKNASAKAAEEGMSAPEIEDMLKPDGEISVSKCLRTIFDPGMSPGGCQILDSSCE